MSEVWKQILGSEEIILHHDLDITPIPDKVLYVNDPIMGTIAEPYGTINDYEMAKTGKTQADGGILPDDNVRIYVPMDLNGFIIMQELYMLHGILGSPDDDNELNYAVLTDKIIQKLEIYDQIWAARDVKNTVRMEDSGVLHSKRGIDLAQEIIDFLEEDEGCAETFPYETIDRLREEWDL